MADIKSRVNIQEADDVATQLKGAVYFDGKTSTADPFVPDFAQTNTFVWNPTATAITLSTPSNYSGKIGTWIIIEKNGNAVTTMDALTSPYKLVGTGTFDGTANAYNIITMVCDGTTVFTYIDGVGV